MATLTASETTVLQKLIKKMTSETPAQKKVKKETFPEAVLRKLDDPMFK